MMARVIWAALTHPEAEPLHWALARIISGVVLFGVMLSAILVVTP